MDTARSAKGTLCAVAGRRFLPVFVPAPTPDPMDFLGCGLQTVNVRTQDSQGQDRLQPTVTTARTLQPAGRKPAAKSRCPSRALPPH